MRFMTGTDHLKGGSVLHINNLPSRLFVLKFQDVDAAE
jgi:hypothetical protein